jgi:hypothetical protein
VNRRKDSSLRYTVIDGKEVKINFSIQYNVMLPLESMKPPKAKSKSSANDPNVLATIMFLPIAAINRNNAEAIWLTRTSRRYCLNNLQYVYLNILIRKEHKS